MVRFEPQSILELKARLSYRQSSDEDIAQLDEWFRGSQAERAVAAALVVCEGTPLREIGRAVLSRALEDGERFNPFVTLLVVEALGSFDERLLGDPRFKTFLTDAVKAGHPTIKEAAQHILSRIQEG
jgi:hypothetical protein